jgi:hypothetical protein
MIDEEFSFRLSDITARTRRNGYDNEDSLGQSSHG